MIMMSPLSAQPKMPMMASLIPMILLSSCIAERGIERGWVGGSFYNYDYAHRSEFFILDLV